MKRRNLLKTAILLPAALRPARLRSQGRVYRPDFEPRNVEIPPSSANNTLDGHPLPIAIAEENAASRPMILDSTQRATLRRLAGEIVPGGSDAGAPEFLEFLAASSPPAMQKQFTNGLHQLQLGAKKGFNRNFNGLEADEISQLLAPLRRDWTYQPDDPPTAFLRQLKSDLWRFTHAGGRPRTYWYEIT